MVITTLSCSLAIYGYRSLRIIHMDNSWDTVQWTFRSWWREHPVSNVLGDWRFVEDDEPENFRRLIRAMDAWKFLGPFFESRGYFLYVRNVAATLDAPTKPFASLSQKYPFARIRDVPEHFEYAVGLRLFEGGAS